ncbi:hypothetical protein PAXINDRAFT_18277 [Paxillus involutus ATCC 200175]|uniref:Uncharacterized protein n=1 Tax=Paxillus involutus ATCC 200175 TaxID=664439 RepID=A0A0C9SZC5_PAXIN|nr:hypothetical protein PAXINDRAFT_18277 [Paxillus involutus ATCC 200175]
MPRSSFTEEQITVLEGVLNEYREIAGKEKVKRKEAIVTRVTRQFVTVHHENNIEVMKKLQNSVRNWLNNRSQELTDKEEYFQKTNWFTVFTSENGDQIKEETQKLTEVAPGSPGSASILPSILHAIPAPSQVIQPHIIKDPPPNFTVPSTILSLRPSPAFFRTHFLPSDPRRLILVSSDHTTHFQSSTVQC